MITMISEDVAKSIETRTHAFVLIVPSCESSAINERRAEKVDQA